MHMKTALLPTVAAALLTLGACATMQAGSGTAGPAGPEQPPLPTRAQAGDTVYLIEHYVRADQQRQFEDFVQLVLWPALEATASANQTRAQILRQTRLLRPVHPEEDGSLTYTFVLDPVVVGESYNVLELLRESYAEEMALQHYARFTATWAREFTSRPFVQSR
jgi:hypothetical protein